MRTSTRRERFAALRAVAELEPCTDSEISALLSYADEVRLFAGDTAAHEGHFCTELVVVMEGALCGGSHLVGPGETVGWAEMWERSLNAATVTAETDARVLVMSHDQFRAVKALVGPGLVRRNDGCPKSPSSEREVQSSLAS
ncbi:MAG TPA: cyclic nucleotide-binding domain-containing protein [Candidatus Dormibacteraeota bacterium]